MKTFDDVVRQYLRLEAGEYNWEEFRSALDHIDVDSISELCEWFFDAGKLASALATKVCTVRQCPRCTFELSEVFDGHQTYLECYREGCGNFSSLLGDGDLRKKLEEL